MRYWEGFLVDLTPPSNHRSIYKAVIIIHRILFYHYYQLIKKDNIMSNSIGDILLADIMLGE